MFLNCMFQSAIYNFLIMTQFIIFCLMTPSLPKICPECLRVCYYFQNIHSLLVWPDFQICSNFMLF